MPFYQVVLLLIFIWFVVFPLGCYGGKLMIEGFSDMIEERGDRSGDDPRGHSS